MVRLGTSVRLPERIPTYWRGRLDLRLVTKSEAVQHIAQLLISAQMAILSIVLVGMPLMQDQGKKKIDGSNMQSKCYNAAKGKCRDTLHF